jgi:hypothetical protein
MAMSSMRMKDNMDYGIEGAAGTFGPDFELSCEVS